MPKNRLRFVVLDVIMSAGWLLVFIFNVLAMEFFIKAFVLSHAQKDRDCSRMCLSFSVSVHVITK